MSSYRKVAITSGDVDGIGLEVSIKALKRLGPQKNTQFILFRSPSVKDFKIAGFRQVQVLNLEDALTLAPKSGQLIEVVNNSSPAHWVEEVAKACLHKDLDSMVTAPLSKQEIQNSGLKDIGHTDILKRVSGKNFAFMTFMGPKFNVLLVSGHVPVAKVEKALRPMLIREALLAAERAKSMLPSSLKRRPMAVLGLNPHAGDAGLIGNFDHQVLAPILRRERRRFSLQGPLVPDVAFLPENWKKYSFYVALYHDQGLIPFKMVHGFDAGVHLTLGLPIKRSSVDHGTAKDLFGKNKANPGSMIEALRWGVRLAHKG